MEQSLGLSSDVAGCLPRRSTKSRKKRLLYVLQKQTAHEHRSRPWFYIFMVRWPHTKVLLISAAVTARPALLNPQPQDLDPKPQTLDPKP